MNTQLQPHKLKFRSHIFKIDNTHFKLRFNMEGKDRKKLGKHNRFSYFSCDILSHSFDGEKYCFVFFL